MKKVMRIGTIEVYRGSTRASVYINVETERDYFSVTGVIGPHPSGNARGGCGQIDMEFAHRNPKDNDTRYSEPVQPSEISFAKGWNAEKWLDLLDVWTAWHLKKVSQVPESVFEFIRSLPETDKTPAWV